MMGAVRSLVFLAAGAAVGGAALIAYRISQETGKPLQEALADVPGEAQRLFADIKARADDAIAHGREMYEEAQQEVEERFQGDSPDQ